MNWQPSNTAIKQQQTTKKNNYFIPEDYYGIEEDIAKAYIVSLKRHIHYVQQAGFELGVSPGQLDIHDNSKWTAAEFPGYALHFQGGGAPDKFAYAWLHHIHNNPHHWQHYIFSDRYTPENSQVENGIVQMPPEYALEMVADWMGASKAYTDSWNMTAWLADNIPRISLHSETIIFIRNILKSLGYPEEIYNQKFYNETN